MGTLNLKTNSGGSVIFEPQNTATDQTVFVPATSGTMATTDQLTGFKNYIINGDFRIWQRGTTGSIVGGPGYVSADRWKCFVNTNTTITLSRQEFAPGQTEVPGNPRHYARFDWLGTGASQFFGFEQLIEDVQHFAGESMTISFYARTEQGDDMTLGVNQKFGTGGSADVSLANLPIELDTTWKKFTYTMAVPSISGKTIGTDSSLSFTWFRTGTLNSYLDIANVQVERGTVATPFEYRPIATELALCQRYYNVASNMWMSGQSYSGGGVDGFVIPFRFPVEMRANPTITFSGGNDGGSVAALFSGGVSTSQVNINLRSTSGNDTFVWFANFSTIASAEL
jgi:hypothetical protein